MGIRVKFTMTTQVMSRYPGFKFQKFLFFAQFYIKFLAKLPNVGEISSRTKSYRQKLGGGGWKTTPSAHRVKK